MGLAGGMNLYGYAGGDPINRSDPFGLCPKSAGGDGKTEDLDDCPRGSSGWWAMRDARGEGSSIVNNVRGVWAVLNNDVRAGIEASLPEGTELAVGVFNLPIGGRISGFTRHGINQAISRDGRGVASWAILDAVTNPTKTVAQADGAIAYIGANARVVLNAAGEVITVIATSSKAWRILP